METFLNREDIVKKYSNKRKYLSEEDVEDLLDCVLGFVKETVKGNEHYAVRLGGLGFIHRDFRHERKKKKYPASDNTIINNMFLDLFTNNPSTKHPLIRTDIVKRFYKNKDITEIQNVQNNNIED